MKSVILVPSDDLNLKSNIANVSKMVKCGSILKGERHNEKIIVLIQVVGCCMPANVENKT